MDSDSVTSYDLGVYRYARPLRGRIIQKCEYEILYS